MSTSLGSTPIDSLQRSLSAQGAPPSHLQRISRLRHLCARTPACLALCLVGSYAKGCGDRVSDLDLAAFVLDGRADEFIEQAHEVLAVDELLDQYAGAYGSRGRFRKYVFLDFTSCELHAFSVPTDFRLRRPFIAVWDPSDFLSGLVVEGEPPKHEDFDAYQHGDEGLIWELVDCIKWLKRGRVTLAKDYLRKLAGKL
jgi:hypothetical protein